jgi:hypothetical protein
VIVGFVILAVILGAMSWHYFGPQSGSAPARALTSAEVANNEWVERQATQTHGDITKLSAEDQRRLYSILGPRAAFEFSQKGRHIVIGR